MLWQWNTRGLVRTGQKDKQTTVSSFSHNRLYIFKKLADKETPYLWSFLTMWTTFSFFPEGNS